MATLTPGDRVRISTKMPPGHVRTPAYLRGKSGTIERVLGPFPNPEELAYGRTSEPMTLYRVTFSMEELWGSGCANQSDTLEAEIYEHWVEHIDAA